jgi:hypothetical protein
LIQQLPFHHKVLSAAKLPLLASEWLSVFGNFARGSIRHINNDAADKVNPEIATMAPAGNPRDGSREPPTTQGRDPVGSCTGPQFYKSEPFNNKECFAL